MDIFMEGKNGVGVGLSFQDVIFLALNFRCHSILELKYFSYFSFIMFNFLFFFVILSFFIISLSLHYFLSCTSLYSFDCLSFIRAFSPLCFQIPNSDISQRTFHFPGHPGCLSSAEELVVKILLSFSEDRLLLSFTTSVFFQILNIKVV